MKKLLLIFLLPLFAWAQIVPTASTKPNPFSYTNAKAYTHVSAGLYSTGGILLKNIFSLQSETAGKHTHYFTLIDNDGNAIAPGNFVIKVSSNNNVYKWLGTLYNNSDSLSGTHVWRGGTPISDMWPHGTKVNIVQSFSENAPAEGGFDTAHARIMINYQAYSTTYAGGLFVCGNGTYRFIASKDYQGAHNFVHAENASNDLPATLTSWTSFTGTPPQINYAKVGDLNALGNTGVISGMAVQQGHNGFLCIAHKNQNVINIFKTSDGSGSFVTSFSIAAPTNLAFDGDGFLWIAQGTTWTKYAINLATGALTSTGISISGFSRIAGADILGSKMLIEDAGTHQVVKEYDESTLALLWTTGTVGGYSTSPTVTNTKFYLEDLRGQYLTYVRFMSNGTWWIGDTGNNRALHFDALGNYIESIAFFTEYTSLNTGVQNGITYNLNVVQNEPTNVFQDFLEFQIDYSQPFSSSYKLKNNWGYALAANWHNTGTITAIDSMTNGRRYAIVTQLSGNNSFMTELATTGLRVITPAITAFSTFDSSGNGDLTSFSFTNPTGNATVTYKRNHLTGYSGPNPTYSGLNTIGTIASGYQEPVPADRTYPVTTSGKLIVFDPTTNGSKNGTPYFHIAAYNSSTFARIWRTYPATFTAYGGTLPIDAYDIGNLVRVPAGNAIVSNNDIFWAYHGEFWKNQQTGIVYHLNDIGLLQGQYGFVGPQIGPNGSAAAAAYPGYFTNTQRISAVKYGNKTILFHPDESIFCGASVWEVDTADVVTQSINITIIARAFTVTPTKTDLMAGNPTGQVSVSGTPGWSQFPVVDYSHSVIDQFKTRTQINLYNFAKSPDIQLYSGGSGTALYYLKRVLTPKTNVSDWTVSGLIDLSACFTITGNNVWIEIDDSSNRAICKLICSTSGLTFDSTLLDPATMAKYRPCPFTLTKKGSNVYLHIGFYGHDLVSSQAALGSSDITNPKYISFNQQLLAGGGRAMQMGIVELYYQ